MCHLHSSLGGSRCGSNSLSARLVCFDWTLFKRRVAPPTLLAMALVFVIALHRVGRVPISRMLRGSRSLWMILAAVLASVAVCNGIAFAPVPLTPAAKTPIAARQVRKHIGALIMWTEIMWTKLRRSLAATRFAPAVLAASFLATIVAVPGVAWSQQPAPSPTKLDEPQPGKAPLSAPSRAQVAVEDPVKLVKQRLHGDWTLVAGMNQGRKLTAKELEGSHVVINDNTLVVLDAVAKELYKASYELEVSSDDRPHRINMTSEIPIAPEKMAFGILQFTKQGWKLAYGLPGTARPQDFSSPAGSKIMFFEMAANDSEAPLISQAAPFTSVAPNGKTKAPPRD